MVRQDHTERSIRKRKRAEGKGSRVVEKCQRMSQGYEFHENDDEDSSSSGSGGEGAAAAAAVVLINTTPQTPAQGRGIMFNSEQLNNSSIVTESPRPVYSLRPSVVNGTILRDVLSKAWRLGRPIGKGNFGEIFLASDDTICPVSSESAKYVVKIEPHSNGPLFVEIHCLINTSPSKVSTNDSVEQETLTPHLREGPPSGIPEYIASGTHYFADARYRFLVLPRFDRDLHSLIKNSRMQQKSLLILAIHIINVLEHLHDKGYCHNDIKAQNLMISKCKYLQKKAVGTTPPSVKDYEEKQQTTDSGNSSEQETTNDDDYFVKKEKFALKLLDEEEEDEEDEDFDDGATSNSNHSNSMDIYQTPVNRNRRPGRSGAAAVVEFSGSNPVRSCRRREKRNSMYEEMVKSHYLRPTKRISYREDFNEDGYPINPEEQANQSDQSPTSSDNEFDDFVPPSVRRSTKRASAAAHSTPSGYRFTRRQQKLKQELANAESSRKVNTRNKQQFHLMPVEEEHVFLIDFGLASKYQDRGVHRPFIMDQRRAHDGTLEFTSRDAHLGAHSRRSDLECLGYNLLYWSQGYLPWKDVAQQQQQEKVHRAKELFMTDVSEMLRQFYGKQVPKYLGDFLQQIGQLAYQERPNYERYRQLFKREYRRLGHDPSQMRLSSDEILSTCFSLKDELDGAKCDIFDLNNKIVSNAIRNSTLDSPFQEHSLTNRVSPKNLRSKSNKKNAKKKKSFSWAEVLSQDPDQIARERAVKEFEREEVFSPQPRRYEGKPTYAILAVEQSRREKGMMVQEHNEMNEAGEETPALLEEHRQEDLVTASQESEDDLEAEESDSSNHSEGRVHNRGVKGKVGVDKSISKPARRGRGRPSRAIPLSAVASNKRGCATRKHDHVTAVASATGEKSTEEDHHHQPKKQRRTRRCLHKTDSLMGSHHPHHHQDVENNSALLDMQQLYGEYDDENSYGKGRNVHASSRHCRK